ncbi:methyl-CpG-binding domain protein 2-like isoform X1 [Mizuhopecten yessoensis]|uniref:methyl-CpG-binding domain protein 2-like isoform X1 n=1 Tax=Mizuhopecten yessoensis TaxID=6573 RepID=UPI000B45F4F0|nr:methyl-CpG-binding domain protein 2-like isoform X1 [Mizuhopecten yessoensis]
MELEKRRSNCGGLPSGWKREEVVRKSGLSVGKTDVYYYSPDGKKIRSKPMLARHLGESLDLSAFDFRTGRIIHSALRKSKRPRGTPYDSTRGIRHDTSLVLPIRQTASIFKQPVTVIRNLTESKSKTDLKHGPQDPPKQLFWEKRLQGMKACDSGDEFLLPLDLPRNVQGVGPELSTENILQSISAALHLGNAPVTGQANNKATLAKNPGVNIDTNQPHIQQMIVSEDDIKRQETKVMEARRKLQDVMKGHL